jgi:6-phosphogluconolactonase
LRARPTDRSRTPVDARLLGTYTGEHSRGIYVSRFDPQTGALGQPELAAEHTNPSFLAVHPSRNLPLCRQRDRPVRGEARRLGERVCDRPRERAVDGDQPAAVWRPGTGASRRGRGRPARPRRQLRWRKRGGPADRCSGALRPPSSVVEHKGSSVNPDRQKRPHAHAVQLDPENRFAYVPDLGIDRVMIYRFDGERGALEPHDPPFAPWRPARARATSRSIRAAGSPS